MARMNEVTFLDNLYYIETDPDTVVDAGMYFYGRGNGKIYLLAAGLNDLRLVSILDGCYYEKNFKGQKIKDVLPYCEGFYYLGKLAIGVLQISR